MTGARRVWQSAFLAGVTAVASWLRLRGLGTPSFWLDEIIHYDRATAAARLPWWKWLVPFEIENGPVFYGLQLAGRVLPSVEASARVAPSVAGIATVVLAWFVARRVDGDSITPYVFAILIAFSPLHVYYSREGRPYALVMLIATLLLADSIIGPSVLAVWTAAIAAPVLAAKAAASRRIPCLVACVAILLLYRGAGGRPDLGFAWPRWHEMLDSFSGSHTTAYAFLILAIIGARRSLPLALMTIGTVALTLAALRFRNHWYTVRYLTPALPGYLLLVSLGVRRLAFGFKSQWIAIALALLLVAPGVGRALTEPFQKLDWRGAAETLRAEVQPWDILLLTNDWSDTSLGFYLREKPLLVNWINVHESVPKADDVMAHSKRAWIVVAGFYRHDEIVKWASRYRVVKADPLEGFRLYFSALNAGNSPSSPGR